MIRKKSLKHIVVSDENYDRLSRLGKAGQSFNDVITEVLKKKSLQQKSDSRPGIKSQTDAAGSESSSPVKI